MRTGLRKNMLSDSGKLIVETSASADGALFFAKFIGWGQSFVGWSEVSVTFATHDLANQAGVTCAQLQAACEFVQA